MVDKFTKEYNRRQSQRFADEQKIDKAVRRGWIKDVSKQLGRKIYNPDFYQRQQQDQQFIEAAEARCDTLKEVVEIYQSAIKAVRSQRGINEIQDLWLDDQRLARPELETNPPTPTEYRQEVLNQLEEQLALLQDYQKVLQKLKPFRERLMHASADDIDDLVKMDMRYAPELAKDSKGNLFFTGMRDELDYFAAAMNMQRGHFGQPPLPNPFKQSEFEGVPDENPEKQEASPPPYLEHGHIGKRSFAYIAEILSNYSKLSFAPEYLYDNRALAENREQVAQRQGIKRQNDPKNSHTEQQTARKDAMHVVWTSR